MAIAIRQIDHVVFVVADIHRALHFYCDVLGCVVERRVASIGLVQMRAGAAMIDLLPAGAGTGPGRNVDHVALRIDPFDEPALRAHLRAHGIEAGAVSSRYGAEGEGPSLYIQDPDGNTIELKGPPCA